MLPRDWLSDVVRATLLHCACALAQNAHFREGDGSGGHWQDGQNLACKRRQKYHTITQNIVGLAVVKERRDVID